MGYLGAPVTRPLATLYEAGPRTLTLAAAGAFLLRAGLLRRYGVWKEPAA
jgi:hypothetical protein